MLQCISLFVNQRERLREMGKVGYVRLTLDEEIRLERMCNR